MISSMTFLSGGTGTPKLLQGLMELVPQKDLSVVVNTGEDVEISGLRVSPDLDTVVYTFAGIIDDEKWYGIRNDSFHVHEMLKELGHEELLRIGDKDRAIKQYRTFRMEEGATLSQATEEISQELGVRANVMPMTDDSVTTGISTERGKMSFHEFWVARGAEDEVRDVNFRGAVEAAPAPGVVSALEDSEFIVIGPSNPVTSLGPILAIDDIKEVLERNRHKTLAVSPVLGDAPVSGPTGVLMEGLGYEVTPVSVARIYSDFVSMFMLHEGDKTMVSEIEDLGMDVYLADLLMPDLSARIDLAREVLGVLSDDVNRGP